MNAGPSFFLECVSLSLLYSSFTFNIWYGVYVYVGVVLDFTYSYSFSVCMCVCVCVNVCLGI